MKFLCANWKMQMNRHEIHAFADQFQAPEGVRIAVAPPYPYLNLVQALMPKVEVFAQNVHTHERGAFTGEVSAPMLRDLGIRGSIVGHSERRDFESDAVVGEKIKALLAQELAVILCVGEKDRAEAQKVVHGQLESVRNSLMKTGDITIAYEPVWAIGTGRTPTIEQIEDMHEYIKRWCSDSLGRRLPVQYGGSVKSSNAAEILKAKNVDGALVGGSSLSPKEWNLICR